MHGNKIVRDVGEKHEWNEARLTMLKELWAKGWSAQMVAHEINTATSSRLTRSAICGKINRLGLQRTTRLPSLQVDRGKPRQKPKTDYGIRRKNSGAKTAMLRHGLEFARENIRQTPAAPKGFKVRQILDGFAADRCEYDSECAAPPIRGRFFCEAHCLIVYRPAGKPKVPDPMRPFPLKSSEPARPFSPRQPRRT